MPNETITIVKFNSGSCIICEGDLFRDGTTPYYINTPSGKRVWICEACADGVQKLFEALGLKYQVIEADKDHA